MAKQLDTMITGRMEDYSFYHDRLHGYLVRRTGGVSAKQYRKDERYAAARDASSEFAAVSKCGKLIRSALSPFIEPVKDGTMVNRLNAELVMLKQADHLNPRGARKPEVRIADGDVNKWLRIFQFNKENSIYDLVETEGRQVNTFWGMKLRSGPFPQNATHAGLTLIRTVIDFEQGSFDTCYLERVLVSKEDWSRHTFGNSHQLNGGSPKQQSLLKGIEIICLQILFFEEKNGALLQLRSKVHSMGIVSIVNTVSCAVKNNYPEKKILQNFVSSARCSSCIAKQPHNHSIKRLDFKRPKKFKGPIYSGRIRHRPLMKEDGLPNRFYNKTAEESIPGCFTIYFLVIYENFT